MVSVPLASTTGTMVQKTPMGGKVHHGADDFQANLVAGFNHFQQRLAFFADCNKGKADDNRKSQHLQHIAVGKSSHRIGGNQVFDGVKNAGHFAGLDIGGCHFKPDAFSKVDGSGDNQPHKACQRCSEQEEYHGTAGDFSGGFGVADAGNAHHDGAEHQRKDHHVQRIHVNAAKQCGNGQDHIKAACQEKPGQDTKHQADKNCAGDVLLIPCKE